MSTGHKDPSDGRKYSIGKKCRILRQEKLLDPTLSEAIIRAATVRHELAHKAATDVTRASEGLTALQQIIQAVLGRTVAGLWFPQSRAW